jgi:hypothetical protein
VIPWFKTEFQRHGQSVCQDHWVAIRRGGRICYAQWSDVGPFVTDDAGYVFGGNRPANTHNGGAGLDISPAVRDFLNFQSGETCDWRFVEPQEIPDGPWKSFGTNNPFAQPGQPKNYAPTPVAFGYGSAGNSSSEEKLPRSQKGAASVITPSVVNASLSGRSRLDELRRQRDAWFASTANR